MAKNILIFSDGTGQEGGEGRNSNVYRLFNMVRDRSPDQIAFYDQGLGTGKTRKALGLLTGYGITKNIKDCYRFIFDNFESGDRIYLFGFSRGAATVRSLSGFIHLFGVLPKSRPELIEKAYAIYKTGNAVKRKAKAEAFVEVHHTMWCRVNFVGVWDTVAALGVPQKALSGILDRIPRYTHHYHNYALHEGIDTAYHALSIDEKRKSFLPTLFGNPVSPEQVVREVWFCGVHTDVGGGYPARELSDITLNWMVEGAVSAGLKIHPGHHVDIHPNPTSNGTMHDSRTGIQAFLSVKARSWDCDTLGTLDVHESVKKRTLDINNQPPSDEEGAVYHPWVFDTKYDDCRKTVS